MLNKTLLNLDIFGKRFGFKIKKEETYKTVFGGTLTFFTLTIIIIFTVFMGQDFYYRINPSVYVNTFVPEKYDAPLPLAPENFTIAWRIEGFEKYPVDFTNIIYPVTSNFKFRRNSKDGMELYDINFLKPTKCTPENAKMQEFTKFNNIQDWYCFDWTKGNFSLGGFFDGDYVSAFNVLLFLCSNPYANYDPKLPNCTKIEDFQKFATKHKRLQISVMYPEYYFDSNDLENPLKITYKNYYYFFNIKTFKIDRFFFTKVVLNDDQGWIFDDTKTSSILSYSKLQSDQNLNDISTLTQSQFYEFNIYMEKSSQVIRRSFMKIQDVSAKVGGLIKLIMTLFSMLNIVFSNFFFQVSVFDEIFDFPEAGLNASYSLPKLKHNFFEESSKKQGKSPKVKTQSQNPRERFNSFEKLKTSQQQILMNTNEATETKCDLKLENRNLGLNQEVNTKINNYVNYAKPSEENLNKNPTLAFSHSINNSKKDLIGGNVSNSNRNGDLNNSQNIKFEIYFWLKSFVCAPKENAGKKKLRILSDLVNFLNIRMDLIYYLKMLYSIDITNSLLFNSTQKKIIDHPAKPNVFKFEDLKLYGLYKQRDENSDNKEILEYYNLKLAEKSFDQYDKKLVQILPERIRRTIDKE